MSGLSRRVLLGSTAALLFTGADLRARAERTWPVRPVRLVTLAAPGGGTDAVARVLAEALAKRWHQPVVVDNRPGGEGIVSIETFLAAREGDHTLMLNPVGLWTTIHLLHERLTFDTARDLVPLSLVVQDFIALAASPKLAASTLEEVMARIRSEPGKLSWASAPSVPYLAFNAFLKSNGLEALYVPYRNPLASVPDLAEGRVDLAFLPLAPLVGPEQAGKLKLLVVANEGRAPLAPQVMTAREAGFPALSMSGGHCLFGPKEMSAALRERIAADTQATLDEPELRQRFLAMGYVPWSIPARDVIQFFARERARWSEAAQAHGIKPAP